MPVMMPGLRLVVTRLRLVWLHTGGSQRAIMATHWGPDERDTEYGDGDDDDRVTPDWDAGCRVLGCRMSATTVWGASSGTAWPGAECETAHWGVSSAMMNWKAWILSMAEGPLAE
jgi:hypothetical protein